MHVIQELRAEEILDSRGRPTVKTHCLLQSGAAASVSVPSGASTGAAEALELRDGDAKRYRGLGCLHAVANVNGEINTALAEREFSGQKELDEALLTLDGTENKSRLGANAILSVSLAFARASAAAHGHTLCVHFAEVFGQPLFRLPRPAINLFSGGKHAGGQVQIQDVMVVPSAARTMDEALAMTYEVFQCAAELTAKKYQVRALRADEGGLAPPASSAEELLTDAMAAIDRAGLNSGRDLCLAVDVAASHFHTNGIYELDGKKLSAAEMVDTLAGWVRDFPIVSVEDGLAENDWTHWPTLRAALSPKALVLGDDFLCTNPGRIKRAVAEQCADALLLKVNQIGTLTEAAEAMRLARGAGWQVMISARSGETEDNWLADLAVGWSADQIKIGSITQSERLAKYNRLLELERLTGLKLNPWPVRA